MELESKADRQNPAVMLYIQITLESSTMATENKGRNVMQQDVNNCYIGAGE